MRHNQPVADRPRGCGIDGILNSGGVVRNTVTDRTVIRDQKLIGGNDRQWRHDGHHGQHGDAARRGADAVGGDERVVAAVGQLDAGQVQRI